MPVQRGVDSPSDYKMVTKAIKLLRGQMIESEELYKKHMMEWDVLRKRWRLKADLMMISDGKSCEKLENALHDIALIQSLLRKQNLELLQFYHNYIQQWITFKLTLNDNGFRCSSLNSNSTESLDTFGSELSTAF